MLPQGLRVSHLPLLGHAFIVYTDHQLALQVLWKDHLVSHHMHRTGEFLLGVCLGEQV